MTTLEIIVIALGVAVVVLGAVGWLLWRWASGDARTVVKRIVRLPLRQKLRLAAALAKDDRIPLGVRAIPPALVVYLSIPLDIVPDFIPVIGHLDDVVVVLVGVGLLLRFAPRAVLEEHLSAGEAEAARARMPAKVVDAEVASPRPESGTTD